MNKWKEEWMLRVDARMVGAHGSTLMYGRMNRWINKWVGGMMGGGWNVGWVD